MEQGLLIPRYLVNSFVYYQLGESVIPDSDYDLLARRIYNEWDDLTHIHKHLLDREGLRSGGSQIVYNKRIEHAAYQLLRKGEPLTNNKENLTKTEIETMSDKPKINSRSKGQRGEREVVKLLQAACDEVYSHYGLTAPFIERNQNQTNEGGYDLIGLPFLAPEVKMCERFQLDKWWEQCEGQATKGELPVLFYRKSRVKWRVRMYGFFVVDKHNRRKYVADISIDDFLDWLKFMIYSNLTAEGLI